MIKWIFVENDFGILSSTYTVYTQQRKQQRNLLTKTILLSLTADVRVGRSGQVFISTENEHKKDVHNQANRLTWLWIMSKSGSIVVKN